jgi:beta-glucosidase
LDKCAVLGVAGLLGLLAATVEMVSGSTPAYLDSRAPVKVRVADLMARMTLPEKAGLLFHTMIGIGPDGQLAAADPYSSLMSAEDMVIGRAMNHFNVVTTAAPRQFAQWHNALQELAAGTRLGIPVTLSTDPRHARSDNPNTSVLAGPFSRWPESLGLAAARDPGIVGRFADTVRREYLAVGLRVALHPQVDLATEPRWPRIVGTFGASADLACALVGPYVRGLQGRSLGPHSVAAMTKHFPGAGPQKDGEDAHFAEGREQVYPGGRLGDHLRPFQAALRAGTSQLMPSYGMPIGTAYEEVGFGFNRGVITGLLRERLGFDGIVCTDWGLLTGAEYHGEARPARAWGVEGLSHHDRALTVLNAGVDQFGGEARPDLVVDLVQSGALSQSRLDVSVGRLLREKFVLGLFDHRYVDPDTADETVGRADFKAAGLAAQRASATLLTNAASDCAAHLPLGPALRVYTEGVDANVAARYLTLVDRVEDAQVAILRVDAPYEHRTGGFATFFHAGPLDFPADELARILAITDNLPTIVDIYLDRPAVIPQLAEHAGTLLATFAVCDEALLDVLTGRATPAGRLPFDLPRSMAAVAAGAPDVAFDSIDPVFRYGHGLSY